MKRYDLYISETRNSDGKQKTLTLDEVEAPDGEYVRWEDVESLITENEKAFNFLLRETEELMRIQVLRITYGI